MQLGLIIGIIFAIVAALFAMQNIAPVTVTIGFWNFEGSLALVLLVTLGLGALIAGLVSSPAMIRRQWNVTRLGRQVNELEHKLAEAECRNDELRAELLQVRPALEDQTSATVEAPVEVKSYVGLRTLITGENGEGKTTP
ncbi:MAG: lipopolysaccharide assembly protein LapA domain-containing protein [Rhodocyclaceae bacterium]|nr:lipopolysaccharide assembly protein LapA domain-containing protein [Rhodocyclaceae bacterium]MDZ4215401.1 lipopolysaccharide assembly protein LapA domain-containing protein [Rhodocyclaceae bacterium]